jgi:non-canonical poly(A) RNA polymerase PAPD5/7
MDASSRPRRPKEPHSTVDMPGPRIYKIRPRPKTTAKPVQYNKAATVSRDQNDGRPGHRLGYRDQFKPEIAERLHAAGIPLEEHDRDIRGPQVIARQRHTDAYKNNNSNWHMQMQMLGKFAHQLSNPAPGDKDDGKVSSVESIQAEFDYSPIYIDTPPSLNSGSLPFPWQIPGNGREGLTGLQLLDLEIERFNKYISLSPSEIAAREGVIKELDALFHRNSVWQKKYSFQVQGSEATGLVMPTSDIDFRVSYISPRRSGNEWMTHQYLGKMLTWFQKAIQGSGLFTDVEYREARYPIITMTHQASGINVQIVAAPTTEPQQSVTARYLAEIPHLRSVYMLLRTALGVRGLVDVYYGGTGAYGLLMMLVAALKRPSDKPPMTAAESYIRFLDFYMNLDATIYGVSADPPKLFKKHQASAYPIKNMIDAARRRGDAVRAAQWAIGQTRLYQPYLLCLQDPANPVNDLGRKSNAIKHLQKTLRVMNNTLRRDFQTIYFSNEKGQAWNNACLLEPQLGRCHELFSQGRRRAEEYGLLHMLRMRREEKMKKAQAAAALEEEESGNLEAGSFRHVMVSQ